MQLPAEFRLPSDRGPFTSVCMGYANTCRCRECEARTRRRYESIVVLHSFKLGIPCNRAKARQLMDRFGGARAAQNALEGMAQAAVERAAA